jgi:3-methyladenine DNA glycosylase/8-oxoguanine DNA glycosylase
MVVESGSRSNGKYGMWGRSERAIAHMLRDIALWTPWRSIAAWYCWQVANERPTPVPK